MFSFVAKTASALVPGWISLIAGGISTGLKPIKYFIDSSFRDYAVPVPGSVLYCDLYFAVEHSGIYVGDGQISNIVVDSLLTADATVKRSTPADFTSASKLSRKIYVSCGKKGAVGHHKVAIGANARVGEQSFYGLVVSNCHWFSEACVSYADNCEDDASFLDSLLDFFIPHSTSEFIPDGTSGLGGIASLKRTARQKLGASTWRLWDWNGSLKDNPEPEPDWQAINNYYKRHPLDAESAAQMRKELAETREYAAEIADESIPAHIRQHLQGFEQTLDKVTRKYEETKDFLAQCPGAGLSYQDLQNLGNEDFTALAKTMQGNTAIQELAHKMGRAYISEQRKKQTRIPEASRSEVHGTQRSDDVMRMLPSELLNLEDEALEHLFYARLLEKQLQTYELAGTTLKPGETTEEHSQRTGPVVACLDTSGSMAGQPLLKAKALLLAIANILQAEGRSLHVVLFGGAGETREFGLEGAQGIGGLLKFLQQGFGGGTDFETPLRRALTLIAEQPSYQKADVLMVSDGDCHLSDGFNQHLQAQKAQLNCMVYSVLCNGQRVADSFSDEVAVL